MVDLDRSSDQQNRIKTEIVGEMKKKTNICVSHSSKTLITYGERLDHDVNKTDFDKSLIYINRRFKKLQSNNFQSKKP